jgi:hypothetical protein
VVSIDLDLNGWSLLFVVAFSVWDVVRDKVDFNVWGNFIPFRLDDVVDGIAPVDRGRHHADEPSGGNVVRGGKSMGAHEVPALLEPLVESYVALEFTERFGGTDADKEANHFVVFVCVDGRVLEASDVLGDRVSGGDVTFHRECAVHGFLINGEKQARWINVLELAKQFLEERLDGGRLRCVNKAVTTAIYDHDDSNVWVPASMTACYAWNSSPIDGTNILHSVAAVGRPFLFPIDISLALPHQLCSNNATDITQYLQFVSEHASFSQAILRLLVEDCHLAHAE